MKTVYPWQNAQWQQLQQQRQAGRLAHALLLHGPVGIGKSDFAGQFAQSLLCETPTDTGQACGLCKGCQLVLSENHPDFIEVEPEEAGKAIKIDQIRAVTQKMDLSSHYGGYRVIIVQQAERMNLSASNSLLKTLEEPQPNTLILLVTSQISRLSATIRSRCQKLRFSIPDSELAQTWLEAELGVNANELLEAATGAPLLARRFATNNTMQLRTKIYSDLASLASGQKQALDVAADWYKLSDADHVSWLYHWVCDLIRLKVANKSFIADGEYSQQLQSQAETIDLGKLYQFFDQVNEAMRLQTTSANSLLLMEGILLGWTYLNMNTTRKRA